MHWRHRFPLAPEYDWRAEREKQLERIMEAMIQGDLVGQGMTAADIIKLSNEQPELRKAINWICQVRSPSANSLGRRLQLARGRIVQGRYIERLNPGTKHSSLWIVRPAERDEKLERVMEAMLQADPAGQGLTAADIIKLSNEHVQLREAVESMCKVTPGRPPSANLLGKRLQLARSGIVQGRCIERLNPGSKHSALWVVRSNDTIRPPAESVVNSQHIDFADILERPSR